MTKAKLGNDSEFYYDETLKAWVDGSDPNGKDVARQAVGSIGGPPPMMTMHSSSNINGGGNATNASVGGGQQAQQQHVSFEKGNQQHERVDAFSRESDPRNPNQQLQHQNYHQNYHQNFSSSNNNDAMQQQQQHSREDEEPAGTSSALNSNEPPPMPRASSFVARQSDVRSRYVDVFNPTGGDTSDGGSGGGGAQSLSGSAADVASFLPPPIAVAKPQKFFVPGPSAKDEDEAKNEGKLESESPHYVENQQVLSPTKRESPHHSSSNNNDSNTFTSDGEHHHHHHHRSSNNTSLILNRARRRFQRMKF